MTIEPARKVGGLTAATASSHPNPTPLVGRDIELQTLMRFLERGGATVVNVTGARGTGKSALVRAAVDLSASGFADIQRLDLTGETLTSALTGLRRHLSRMPIVLHRDIALPRGG